MTNDRRNPYLILGVPYGSSKREVRKGFARRAKEIKNETYTAYRIEDLNWALQQLEQAEKEPELDFECFRAPANQSLFNNDLASGFFNPSVKAIVQKSPEFTDSDIRNIIDQAVNGWVNQNLKGFIKELKLPYPTSIKEG